MGHTGRYLKSVTGLSIIALIGQIVFHVTLLCMPPYSDHLPNCDQLEKLIRQLGFQRLDKGSALDLIRLIGPDILMAAISVVVLVICQKVPVPDINQFEQSNASPEGSQQSPVHKRKTNTKAKAASVLYYTGELLVLVFMAFSGIVYPSALSAVYFLSFLAVATWWACYRSLGRVFVWLRLVLLTYTGLHLLLLYLYQFQFFQDVLSSEDLVARVIGLTALVLTTCDDPRKFLFAQAPWTVFVNPLVLLIFYWLLAYYTRLWMKLPVQEQIQSEEDITGLRPRPLIKRRYSGRQQVGEYSQLLHDQKKRYDSTEKLEADGSTGEPNAVTATPEPQADIKGEGEEEEEREREGDVCKQSDITKNPFISILLFIAKQSYIASLIIMMAWGITYHSWLTFILLLWACLIWVLPNSRRVCMLMSPAIVMYAECLLIIQFIYGMNLNDNELPLKGTTGDVNFRDIGLVKYDYPCLPLGVKILFTVMFWVMMRQFMRARSLRSQEGEEGMLLHPVPEHVKDTRISLASIFQGPPKESTRFQRFTYWLLYQITKYWIFVCAAMFLLMSMQNSVVLYRIVYMLLFLIFVIMFQISFRVWRVFMLPFWIVVVLYSMVVLVLIYTYQFENFPDYWRNATGLSDEALADIGLEQFDIKELFVSLLTPTSFLIIVILQLHYFHKAYYQMIDIEAYKKKVVEHRNMEHTQKETCSESQESFEKDVMTFWQKLRVWLNYICELAWRLLEIHIIKIVTFTLVMLAVYEVTAVNFFFIIFAVLAPMLSFCGLCISHIAAIWAALLIIVKMCFQLQQINSNVLDSNCTNEDSPFNETTVHNGVWLGLEKTDNIGFYLKSYIIAILILSLQGIVRYRQQHHRAVYDVATPKQGVVFPEANRKEADKGLVECGKYFVNYIFYKFGLEICFLMTVITVAVRIDAFAVIYILFLGILLLLSRPALRIVWPVYVIILAILLPLQFLLCLGLLPYICESYPWSDFKPALREWMYLPDYWDIPDSRLLIADFFQLLFAIQQWAVFRIEKCDKEYEGGDNDKVDHNAPNPTTDFITSGDTYLDKVKTGVFLYTYWVVLAILFLAGTSRVSLYCMGYVLFCFLFLWFGNEFYLKPMKVINRMWNIVLAYNFCVMLLKACLEVVGCVYLSDLYKNFCWLVQLLSIACLRSSYDPSSDPDITSECSIPFDQAGLSWDCVCFIFLLLQRRIFMSYYFKHVVAEIRAQTMLASRGAELILEIFIGDVREREKEEAQVVSKIKKKLDRITANQAKINENAIKDPETHFEAIRAGDYYMFDDDFEVEPAITQLGEDESASELDEEGKPKSPGPLQLLNVAYQAGDVKKAVDEAKQVKEQQSVDDSEASTTEVKSPALDQSHEGCDPHDEATGDDGEEAPKQSCWSKVRNGCAFVWLFICGIMDSIAAWLNKISKDYRYVARILSQEKRQLKEENKELQKIDVISDSEKKQEEEDAQHPEAHLQVLSVTIEVPEETSDNQVAVADEMPDADKQPPSIINLLLALYYAVISRSELMCYFIIVLNQIGNASVISMPLPLLVFFWGTLSVPRPTKTFWITLITYTEAVVVIKYLFQFNFYPWHDDINTSPFWPPRIIGIEKRDKYAAWELVTLLALFFHRSILKSLGLWKDSADDQYKKHIDENSPNEIDSDGESPKKKSLTASKTQPETDIVVQEGEGDIKEEEDDPEAKAGINLYISPFKKFFNKLLRPVYRLPVDVYVFLFFCDFICFLIIVLGYSAFGTDVGSAGDVATYIQENKIPIPFLVMLIAQFALIIIDRGIFLKKSVFAKLIYQFILIIIVHLWMFFILPAVTERLFVNNIPAKLWYFVKCAYLVLSAYQIRSGYPIRILGNFMTKSYNYVNLIAFKIFTIIPFIMEMRALMDWMWTDTTLSVFNWLKVEDIYANIFCLKCARRAEAAYPTPRATPRKAVVKYLMGGGLLFLIIFIIWFPLILFSLGNVVGVRNLPFECNLVIQIGGYEPIIQMSAQEQDLVAFTQNELDTLQNVFSKTKNSAAKSFFGNYEAGDVLHVNLPDTSTAVWSASPPSKQDMIKELEGNLSTVHMKFSWSFTRYDDGSVAQTELTDRNNIDLEPGSEIRAQLVDALKNPNTNTSARILNILPKYMQVTSSKVRPATQLMPNGKKDWITVLLELSNSTNSEWWQLTEENSDHVVIIAFFDKVFPSTLSFLAGYGIIGLYISLVLVVGRFVRMFVSGLAVKIMFEELPNVDNVLQLLLDIYLVRESKEFALEEDLFARLIFLYRSPATLIKWTKPKQD